MKNGNHQPKKKKKEHSIKHLSHFDPWLVNKWLWNAWNLQRKVQNLKQQKIKKSFLEIGWKLNTLMLQVVLFGDINNTLGVTGDFEVFLSGPSAFFLYVVPFICWFCLKIKLMKYYLSLEQILDAQLIRFPLILLLMIGINLLNKD